MADGHELPIPQVTLTIDFFSGVTHCPPGNAFGCHDLNNRGHDYMYEVTCWPKQQAGKFTTGERQPYTFTPEPITLNQEEKRVCAILGIDERDLHTFLRSWEVRPRPDDIPRLYATTNRPPKGMAFLPLKEDRKETVCTVCGHTWLVSKGRGRPHQFCPSCRRKLESAPCTEVPTSKGEHD